MSFGRSLSDFPLNAIKRTVLFLGATDTGKTTLARRLYKELQAGGEQVAYLDCDIGQSTVGPPTTIGLEYTGRDGKPHRHLFFVGSSTPRGHFLPMVVGAYKLRNLALQRGCATVLVDTTGLVDPRAGGTALKLWKIELLRPTWIVAIQRQAELSSLLEQMHHHYEGRLTLLAPATEVRARDRRERTAYRQRLWRSYFAKADSVTMEACQCDVWDFHLATPGRLVGLDDAAGLCLGLGVITDTSQNIISLATPLKSLDRVERLRLGSIRLDWQSGLELGVSLQ
ncbi:MAG: Clp1/GlmU family protein [Anaerolineae bacterium]